MIKISQGRPHKTLRQNDPDFTFSPDGIRVVPRASFEISEKCPSEYQRFCMNAGATVGSSLLPTCVMLNIQWSSYENETVSQLR